MIISIFHNWACDETLIKQYIAQKTFDTLMH